MNHALKAIGEDRIGGYLVVWGNPQQRDLQGEYFTPDTDLGLDWYPVRPVLYHHGLDDAVKAETVGKIDLLRPDDTGLWAEAQLDMAKQYARAVRRLVDQGVLGWSSGSLPHLVEYDADRRIKRWPIVEGSLTPTPAEPRHTNVSAIKAIYEELGLDTTRLLETYIPATDEPPAPPIEPTAKEASADEPPVSDIESQTAIKTQPIEVKMDINQIIMSALQALMALKPDLALNEAEVAQIVQQVSGAIQTPEVEVEAGEMVKQVMPMVGKAFNDFIAKRTAQSREFQLAAENAALKFAMSAPPAAANDLPGMTGQRMNGNGNGQTAPRISEMRNLKFAELDAADLSFLAELDLFNRRSGKATLTAKQYIRDDERAAFMGELADKAAKAVDQRKMSLDAGAMKAIRAIKANELDHSTQSSYGDEWVPTLWSNDIWRRARLENVILPLFRSIDMPSNPFELPVESTDPTVYFVPETTDEAQLLISGAGSAIPDSKIGSGKVTLSAKKLGLRVGFSAELEEDSIIPVISIYREQAQRAMMDAIDHVILNGDDTNAGTGNINSDDADPADTEKYLAFNGLLHSALVEDTTRRLDASAVAPSLANVRQMRFKLPIQYAQRLGDLAFVVGGEVYAKLLTMSEFLTVDKYGPNATIMTGELGRIDNIPVLTSAEFGLAEADGKKSATPGNNTLGRMLTVFRPGWYVGYRRRVAVDVSYLPYLDSYQLTVTARLGLVHLDDDSAAVLYNLAV